MDEGRDNNESALCVCFVVFSFFFPRHNAIKLYRNVIAINGCVNLKIGHETGLDILSHTKKFAIELKNRTNTDNASSKKSNLDKLAKFKKHNPDYVCIYANINADTEKKTLKGSVSKLLHNGVEIEHQIGYVFIKFILGDDTDIIISFVKNTIDKYT